MAFIAILVLSLACYLMESRNTEDQQAVYNDIEENWAVVPADIQGPIPDWVEKLNAIPLPAYMQDTSLINVYFKYNQPVSGYDVTARWRAV